MYKRKKACEYLPVFQLSLTKFWEIQKQLKKKTKKNNETSGHIEDLRQKFFNEVPRS